MNTNQGINIIEHSDGELRVSSMIVAQRTENQHASVLRVIRDNISDFEEFGRVGFEIAPFETAGGTQRREVAHLNEPQSTLLITFMRNSDIVKAFKVELVKQFYTMRQALAAKSNPLARPELVTREALARMVLEAEEEKKTLEAAIESQAPIVAYHDRFVAESSDIITVENFASQFGTTEPKVRELLKQKNIAVRRCIGQRWSKSKQKMVDEFEWRARQGTKTSAWFDLRPQHNAPRLHNGQVRQTLYVVQFHANDLANLLGLVESADVERRASA